MPGNFGRRRDRSDVLWLGVKTETDLLGEIARALSDEPVRKFVPHLTIARIKDAGQATPLINEHLEANFPPQSFLTQHLVMYESTLQPSGPVYSVLSEHPLSSG